VKEKENDPAMWPYGFKKSSELKGDVFAVQKSQKQLQLEAHGCVFKDQELLSAHEIDPMKECYCGRPNKILKKAI
jgi:hypothetical protein